MNRESIEKLTIDKQAGELSDEAIQLLDEYLGQHPDAQAWYREIGDMYDKCQEAFCSITVEDAPAIKRMQSKRAGLNVFHGKAAFRAAAILLPAVFSFYLGILWQDSSPVENRQTISETFNIQSQNIDRAKGQSPDFWQSRLIMAMQAKPSHLKRPARQSTNFWAKFKNNTKGADNE